MSNPDPIYHNEQVLAQAIIMQAVRDWRDARYKLYVNPSNHFAESDMRSCERFFRSVWFQRLTTVDGRWLLRRMKSECPNRPRRGFDRDCLSIRNNSLR